MTGPLGAGTMPLWNLAGKLLKQLHVGRAIRNFYRAEHDPLSTDVVIDEGYSIRDGLATVPDSPGFGLTLDSRRIAAAIKPRFDARE